MQAENQCNFQCTSKLLVHWILYTDCTVRMAMDDIIELLAFLELSEANKTNNYSTDFFNEEMQIWGKKTHTSWNFITSNRRIASVSTWTSTIWRMIGNETFSIWTTDSDTWIHTFQIHARFGLWTVTVHHTFRSTFDVWVTIIFGYATTWANDVSFSAYCIYSTWICLTSCHFWFMVD